MKWKKRIKNKPPLGDVRIIKKFAWLPVLINDYYIWLEKYNVQQKYKNLIAYSLPCMWVNIKIYQ